MEKELGLNTKPCPSKQRQEWHSIETGESRLFTGNKQMKNTAVESKNAEKKGCIIHLPIDKI